MLMPGYDVLASSHDPGGRGLGFRVRGECEMWVEHEFLAYESWTTLVQL